VVWIRTDAPGSSDRAILARAQAENRIIITFDKDFGELAFRFGLPATSGIILFRISPASPTRIFVARSHSLHHFTTTAIASLK
jgi:predicted nuclease of predicted toxin-antitoxin system